MFSSVRSHLSTMYKEPLYSNSCTFGTFPISNILWTKDCGHSRTRPMTNQCCCYVGSRPRSIRQRQQTQHHSAANISCHVTKYELLIGIIPVLFVLLMLARYSLWRCPWLIKTTSMFISRTSGSVHMCRMFMRAAENNTFTFTFRSLGLRGPWACWTRNNMKISVASLYSVSSSTRRFLTFPALLHIIQHPLA